MTRTCRICAATADHREIPALEMMYGTREMFTYFECGGCGCVQLVDIPEDLSRFYPRDYYTFRPAGRLRRIIKGAWLPDRLTVKNFTLRVLSSIPLLGVAPAWISRARMKRSARVLDVGCGGGERLLALQSLGFRNLTGIDPFLPEGVGLDGVRLINGKTADLDETFDLVTLHHSFEHMPDPVSVLRDLTRLLSPGGCIVLRVPLASSAAWREYGADWVQLDPPRHLFLHTDRSLEILATWNHLEIVDRFRDSTAFQFWGSEQYRRGIPLFSPGSYAVDRDKSMFSPTQIRAFEKKAEALNRQGEGDQGVFYLRRPGN